MKLNDIANIVATKILSISGTIVECMDNGPKEGACGNEAARLLSVGQKYVVRSNIWTSPECLKLDNVSHAFLSTRFRKVGQEK